MNENLKKIKECMNEIECIQKFLIENIEKNIKNITKNNMSDYMTLEKKIMLNVIDLKEKEKELITALNGEKISEKINEADLLEEEKEKMKQKVEALVMNYKNIEKKLEHSKKIIEPKVAIGEIILQTVNEELKKINSEGGKIYDEKI